MFVELRRRTEASNIVIADLLPFPDEFCSLFFVTDRVYWSRELNIELRVRERQMLLVV